MKLSDKLHDLSTRLGVGEVLPTPLNTPSNPMKIGKVEPQVFVRAALDCGLGYPTAYNPMREALYICFLIDINTKIEFLIATPESENFWNLIKKSMVDEFANRFSRIQ